MVQPVNVKISWITFFNNVFQAQIEHLSLQELFKRAIFWSSWECLRQKSKIICAQILNIVLSQALFESLA